MPFGPITVLSKTFNQSGDGRYMRNSVTFGQPHDYFTIKGGSLTKDRQNISAAVSRILEKDITVNGNTSRRSASVQLVIQVPSSGFTSADIDSMTAEISEFVTQAITDRLMSGES